MLCQNCNKNIANVRYTQIINGQKKEMMLCEECSEKLGVNKINFNMPIDFSSFFGGMLEDPDFMPLFPEVKQLKCDNCNLTFDDFINSGKLGCPSCYDAFSEKIDPILKRIHGSNRYLGKKLNKPDNLNDNDDNGIDIRKESVKNRKVEVEKVKKEKMDDNKSKKEILEEDLKKAILDERYEDAAKIRDEIKMLKEE